MTTRIILRRRCRVAYSSSASSCDGSPLGPIASWIVRRIRSMWTSRVPGGTYSARAGLRTARMPGGAGPATRPTRSPWRVASWATTPAASTATSRLVLVASASAAIDRPVSTMSITACWRVATKRLTSGRPLRAVAFQSRSLTSSPSTYSRRSSKSMLRPLWIDPCSPSRTLRTFRWAWTTVFALTLRSSDVGMSLRGWDDREDGVDDVLDADAVGHGLEPEVETVAEHGMAQRPQVVREHERAA